jgi:hypothetical protein
MLPYRTDEGLYLEDEGVLIPWGTPLKPDVPPRGAELRRPGVFEWKARRALGGILGDIFAVLFPVDDPIQDSQIRCRLCIPSRCTSPRMRIKGRLGSS